MYKIFEETQIIGKEVIFLPKCRSTNDTAVRLIKKGAAKEGTIIITDHQLKGRGQQGNIWISEPEQNLTFSIILKPNFLNPNRNFYLSIFSSLAIQHALQEYSGKTFRIKWPNDIMFGNRKIAGLLIENQIQSDRIDNAIIGIGLNLNQTGFDPELNAISLKQIGKTDYDRNHFLNTLIHHLDITYLQLKNMGGDDLKIRYLSNLFWINEEHSFSSETVFKGRITGIDEYGRLQILSGDRICTFNFKEITYLK